ncbi:MAG TPA: hypothetical protein V6C81_00770 [Planktothrix sp.]|jgi:hypothetical protein
MTQKLAYLWGPISAFSGPLAALLVNKGWHLHIATKSSLNLFSLVPLDLRSAALDLLETALGGHEKLRTFQDRIKLIDESELNRATKYDAIIFCGMPPNFDEPRAPRAHWAAARLPAILKALKGTPIYLVSSIWGGVQKDGVVPEEFEFMRRKPVTQWEGVCQHYEQMLLQGLEAIEGQWYLVRIPMISGNSDNGEMLNFTGPTGLFREIAQTSDRSYGDHKLHLRYNPDATLPFLPADIASQMFWRYLEDEQRPRICNIVSTAASLNQEWLQFVARSAGLKESVPNGGDSLNIPSTLRKMLLDTVQVKTRNLFEVAGRYQLPPVRMDQEYFDKVLRAGKHKRWGRPSVPEKKVLGFSERLAQYYFEEFVPSHIDEGWVKKVTTGGTTIGFMLKGPDRLGWVIKTANPDAKEVVVERLDPAGERPKICFRFTGTTMTQLIQSKLPLHRALLLREVEVEGPLLQALKMTNIIEQFLREHPMSAEQFAAVDEH